MWAAGLQPAQAQTATAAGTRIENIARIDYTDSNAQPRTFVSNRVVATVAPPPSPSSLTILRASTSGTTATTAGPTQCLAGSSSMTLPNPVLIGGGSVDPTQPLSLASSSTVHGGEAVFVQVRDADKNLDAAVIDTVQITLTTPAGDRETLQLAENGVNTGVFVGYVQSRAGSVTAGNCVLEVARNASIDSVYVDSVDARDTSSARALIDPYGMVFDSATGAAISGARVRLIDTATGALATVFGDDGVSRYPAEMVTGESVTDAGGTTYSLPAGVFRFPLIATGNYRLEVDPPAGHIFPTALSVTDLAAVPGGPYRIQGGSFGRDFAVTAGPTVALDVPVDASVSQLFMRKSTATTVAAVGDFVQYILEAENTSTNAAIPRLRIVDQLPAGARYRQGSARIAGAAAADPAISADGRTLTFTHGRLAAGQRVEFRYVVEITVAARGRELVNSAQAIGPDGVASNSAQASIQLREELFREHAVIMGRVVEGECSVETQKLPGVAGVRVYLEDGRYAVTDEDGKYHFDDVTPGAHVVQYDTVTVPETLQPLECADRVRHAGRAYSQFADVRGGALWRADFVLQKKPLPVGAAILTLDSALDGATQVRHTATLTLTRLGADQGRVLVMLPDGLKYQKGSARLGAQPIDDPAITDNVLSFALAALPADATTTLNFRTDTQPGAAGLLTVKAVATIVTATQPALSTAPVENAILRGEMLYEKSAYRFSPRFDELAAEVLAADRAQLDRIVEEWHGIGSLHLKVVGHTDSTPIAVKNRALYADNYALSQARAAAVAKYLVEGLGIDPANVTAEGRGPDEPLVAGRDAASLARNRRVEIEIDGLRVLAAGSFSVKRGTATSPAVETVGAIATSKPVRAAAPTPRAPDVSTAAGIDIEALQPGTGWVSPGVDDVPVIPAIKVAIQHAPTQRVELRINGAAVGPLNFDGTASNAAKSVALSRWRGVDLRDGNNTLLAIVRDENDAEVQRLERSVHYSGGAVRAEIVRESSTLLADGRVRPVIALRLIDAYGKPARPGTLGTYRVEAPYRSWWEVESLNDNKTVAIGKREPTFSVDDDGLARVELEPTTQAGTAVIRLRFNERQQQDIRVWLEPQAREWILVGLASGTTGYNQISDNMQSAADAGLEEGYQQDGRVAFFAKGTIKGEYLLTLAYDSAREREVAQERLLGVIEPDRYYTLYGDATEQRFEAATTRKLFVKLERRQFAALFGDFESGLTVTELSRYNRTFTGIKSDYAGEHFGYTAFAAETTQGFVKDELQGDGTSGLYRLSQRPLIINSDKIRIEVRDRFRSEVVVETRTLTRHIDYSVDYANGTLFFKQPVPSRDGGFNPVYIIAEYEVLNGGEAQLTAGGRASLKFADDHVEVGASFIHQGAVAGDTQVAGTDLRWQIGAATQLKAEIARSESDDPSEAAAANAYLTELTHVTEKLDARAYVREQEAGFGVRQQLSTEEATRKIGIDGRYRVSEHVAIEAETYRQEMLDSGAQRELVSAEVRREMDDYMLGLGARHVADNESTAGETRSEQAFVSGSLDLFDDRITLRGSQDFALGGRNGSVDFPNRSVIGIDYNWSAETTFFTEYEHADGAEFKADMTRVGVRTAPWERAQLQSSLNQQASEFGPRVFANVGLTQGWQMNERWSFDVGVDQSRTVRGSNLRPLNARSPLASGSLNEDFLATFVGAMYRSEFWTLTSRLENRHSDEEDRRVLSGGFYREPLAGHAFSLATQYFDSDFADGSNVAAGEVQLAWAYRPVSSRWIVLDRFDVKHESRSDTLGEFESSRFINNLNANWQMDLRAQLGLQSGARYVRSTFDGERYNGLSTLWGLDLRRELTQRFDVGIHGTMLNSLQSNVSDTSVGVDVGFVLAKNVWISVGYNFSGFRDDDFEASRYTAQGPFIKFRMKADQDTFKDLSLDALRPGRRN